MSFLKLLLSFAPWISFLIIAQGSLLRLKIGLVVALVLSVAMGVAKLHRGVILGVGLAFFTYATVAVVLFEDMWTVRHMGVLANGALAAASWFTVVAGKPFTLDYAKTHTDPTLWKSPSFIRTNFIITSVWSTVFTLNAIPAWGKMAGLLLPPWGFEVLSYSFMVTTAAFTSWYPVYVRRHRGADAHG